MANPIAFLSGLIRIPDLSYVTGISRSTLYRYQRGLSVPDPSRMTLLKNVYANIQSTRLQAAGLPEREALRLSTLGRRTVEKMLEQTENTVYQISQLINEERMKAGQDLLSDDIFRRSMAESDKTVEEIWDSP